MNVSKCRLTPICFIERKNYKDIWLYRCECGNEKMTRKQSVDDGLVKSCGCILNPSRIEYLKSLNDRIMEKSSWNGTCLEYNGKLNKGGYGTIAFKNGNINRPYGAHRAMYLIHHGQIDDDKLILHSCHNRKCVNIAHLREGTYKENSNDMFSANRFPVAEKSYQSKCTNEEVLHARSLYEKGMKVTEISNITKIAYPSLWYMLKRKTWKSI